MSYAKTKLYEIGALLGITGLVAGAGIGIVAVAFVLAIGIFAAVTLLQALILWVVWNWTAPHLDVIPVAYQHIDFLVMWGVVAVLRIVGRILFGTTKKESK